ncbi:MAG TPA: hypothetical protein VF988_09745, partial [Verrucomicrobiae bacterium]
FQSPVPRPKASTLGKWVPFAQEQKSLKPGACKRDWNWRLESRQNPQAGKPAPQTIVQPELKNFERNQWVC